MQYVILVDIPESDMDIETVCSEMRHSLKGNIRLGRQLVVRPLSEVLAC
jgi:hypothetical protein